MDRENIFGFSTAPAGGNFLPIVKYDAKAGRMFRIDKKKTIAGIENDPVDITQSFKAVLDFENIQTGWLCFVAGTAPDVRLVPMGSKMPAQPTANHKPGIRFMLKLSKECAANEPSVREIAGTAKSTVSGVGNIYIEYLEQREQHPGQLPVVVLEKTMPVKTGTGITSSTNYHPVFKIVGWVPRPVDLVFTDKGGAAASTASSAAPPPSQGQTPPSTGSTQAAPPSPQQAVAQLKQMADAADDFG